MDDGFDALTDERDAPGYIRPCRAQRYWDRVSVLQD
jgi:hypothetical protein